MNNTNMTETARAALALIDRAASFEWRNPALAEHARDIQNWAHGPRTTLPPDVPGDYPVPAGVLTSGGALRSALRTACLALPCTEWHESQRAPDGSMRLPSWALPDAQHNLDCAMAWGAKRK